MKTKKALTSLSQLDKKQLAFIKGGEEPVLAVIVKRPSQQMIMTDMQQAQTIQ